MSLFQKFFTKNRPFELPPLPIPAKKKKGISLGDYVVEDRLDEVYQLRPNRRAQLWQARPQKGHASFIGLVTPGKQDRQWLESQLGTEGVALRSWLKVRDTGVIRQRGNSLSIIPFDTILNNRYLLRRKLVTDGVQETYKAWDVEKKRWVCCTVCIPQKNMPTIAKLVPRTFETSKTLVRTIHPRILNVLDENICKPTGIFCNYRHKASGLYYIVTEYVSDINFTQYLRNLKRRASLENILTVLCEVVDLVEWLHENRWFHGNIRPHSLWIAKKGGDKGHLYLNGFSMRKAGKDRDSTGGNMLRNTADYGFPLYMSPEQVKGKKIDSRAEQFCLGILMARLLWGQHPFYAKSRDEVFRKMMTTTPQPKKSSMIPDSLTSLVLRCLARSPAKRFANPTEIRHRINQQILPEVEAKLQEMKLVEGEEIVSSELIAIKDEDIIASTHSPKTPKRKSPSTSDSLSLTKKKVPIKRVSSPPAQKTSIPKSIATTKKHSTFERSSEATKKYTALVGKSVSKITEMFSNKKYCERSCR